MSDIWKKFQHLDPPLSDKSKNLSTKNIDKFGTFKVGKDFNSNPHFIILTDHEEVRVSDLKTNEIKTDFYKNDEFTFDDEVIEKNFYKISYIGGQEELKQSFLLNCEILIKKISNDKSKAALVRVFKDLIRLWSLEKNIDISKVYRGLWCELFLIENSIYPDIMVKSWHSDINDVFDFAFDNFIIEVKGTSSSNRRSHIFNFKQLRDYNDENIFISSIIAEKVDNGKSIKDLIDSIKNKLSDKSLIEKVELKTAETLKKYIYLIDDYKYNHHVAEKYCRIYHFKEIPRISHIPDGISDLSYKSNLDNIPYISDNISEFIEKNNSE